jgi:hypothetical protein
MSGQIIPADPVPEQPSAIQQEGSPIQAAGKAVELKTNEQIGALEKLGHKLGGRRRLRGGAEVEVKNVPSFPSAGGIDAKQVYAGLLETAHQAASDAKFDSLGNATPVTTTATGGRRRKTRKVHNGRHKRSSIRKRRGSARRTRRVRNSRR